MQIPSTRYKNTSVGIFLGLTWLYGCIHLDRQILGILAESVKSDLHLDDRQLGSLTGTAFSIVYALLGLYFGSLADRFDRLVLVRTGAWVWSLSCAGAALASNYPMLVASRAGVAVGEAIATAAAVSLISELTDERFRARGVSLFLTSAFVGAGTAAIVGGMVEGHFQGSAGVAGWRVAIAAAGLPGILGALFLSFFRRAEGVRRLPIQTGAGWGVAAVLTSTSVVAVLVQMREPPAVGVPICILMAAGAATWWALRLRRRDSSSYRATLGRKPFRYFIIAFAAVLFSDYAASFWLIPFAQRRFGMDAATLGSQMGGAIIVGGIAGCLMGGWSADRWRASRVSGRVWTALIAVLCEGSAILFAIGQTDYRAFMLAFCAFCISSGGWTGVAAAVAFDVVPAEHRGTGTAAYFLVTTILGPGLGPFVVGLGSDLLGSVGTALSWGCAVLLIAATALIRLGSLLERSGPRGQRAH